MSRTDGFSSWLVPCPLSSKIRRIIFDSFPKLGQVWTSLFLLHVFLSLGFLNGWTGVVNINIFTDILTFGTLLRVSSSCWKSYLSLSDQIHVSLLTFLFNFSTH